MVLVFSCELPTIHSMDRIISQTHPQIFCFHLLFSNSPLHERTIVLKQGYSSNKLLSSKTKYPEIERKKGNYALKFEDEQYNNDDAEKLVLLLRGNDLGIMVEDELLSC